MLCKLLQIIHMILNHFDNKSENHVIKQLMKICSLADWIKIAQLLYIMYSEDVATERVIVDIFAKLAHPNNFEIESEESEKALDDLTERLISCVKRAHDVVLIGAALEAVTDIFHNEKFNFFFFKHQVFATLFEGLPNYKRRLDDIRSSLDEEDYAYCKECVIKVDEFLAVKHSQTNFEHLDEATKPLLADYTNDPIPTGSFKKSKKKAPPKSGK